MDYPFTMEVTHKVSGWVRGAKNKTEARRAVGEYARSGIPGPVEILIDEVGKAQAPEIGEGLDSGEST